MSCPNKKSCTYCGTNCIHHGKGGREMKFKDLNKKEMRHLRAQLSSPTLRNFKIVAEYQKSLRDAPDFQQYNEPCYECKEIARKLGLPI
jgi:hypothetical protein